jgi:hypothetical protein
MEVQFVETVDPKSLRQAKIKFRSSKKLALGLNSPNQFSKRIFFRGIFYGISSRNVISKIFEKLRTKSVKNPEKTVSELKNKSTCFFAF